MLIFGPTLVLPSGILTFPLTGCVLHAFGLCIASFCGLVWLPTYLPIYLPTYLPTYIVLLTSCFMLIEVESCHSSTPVSLDNDKGT